MQHLFTIVDAVATFARLQPNKLAVRDSRRGLSFKDWNQRSAQLATGLMTTGLIQGDRVAVLAYNCIEWAEIYVGLAYAGLVAVPINFRLTSPEIAYILENSGARAVIVQDELCDRVELIGDSLNLSRERMIQFGEPVPGWKSYEDVLSISVPIQPATSLMSEDIFALMYTSGTTGRPKGAVRTHGGNQPLAMATALEMGFSRDDTALLVMPMGHANSLYFSLTFLYLGATILIDDRKSFDPEGLLMTLSRDRVTFTSLVPTHFIMMLSLPTDVKEKYDVTAVGKLLISSAPARKDTKLAILDYFKNCKLFELYGSTEAGWVTLLPPNEQINRLGSVGREWAGSGAIKLLDSDGNEVPDGEIGELYSRTTYVFDGYWQNNKKTSEAFRHEWCSVGDMALRDSDGYIYLVDRKSNMIITGGENVYPSEVEGVLGSHHKVRDVAVIGLPHEKWGEAVAAVIVLHAGEQATETEILNWLKDRLAGFKCPKYVFFIAEEDMPRTATGKILHRILREKYVSEIKHLALQA
jgi:fatty-acyl-CoA synthase